MQLRTLLNHVQPVKGFVYQTCTLRADVNAISGHAIDVTLRPRKGSRGICTGCGQRAGTYDTQTQRRFAFVPLWGMAVYLLYTRRRVNCPRCGVKVEALPWANGKQHITHAMSLFLSRWAKRLSWQDTARCFGVSWECVYRSVQRVVAYGLSHRDLSNVNAIGIDEVAYRKGHRYLTLVYQIDEGMRRLLHVREGRNVKSLLSFFRTTGIQMGKPRSAMIRYVCSDMWRPYLKVIARKLPGTVHILDRYHIVANLHKALDQVRATEAKRLTRDGYEPVLSKTRWCFLKRKSKLTKKQKRRLDDVLCYDLKTVRAYLKVQAFDALWQYQSPTWAGRFLDDWCTHVMRSRIEPLKRVARQLRQHRQLILNWFVAQKQFSNGIVEGLNANVKLGFKKAYGFRTVDAAQTMLYHQLGKLPEPEHTHRFC